MLDKDHALVSEAVCLGYVLAVHDNSINLVIPSLAGVFIGSQIPDMDNGNSRIGKYTRPLSTFIAHFGHRGITHSLWGLAMFGAIVYFGLYDDFYPVQIFHQGWNQLCIWLVLGYALHLIEDWFSTGGLIWFFPFGHYRRWIPPSEYKRPKRKRRPTYIQTRITKWFRYESTVSGKKGAYERCIRHLAYWIIIIEVIMLTMY